MGEKSQYDKVLSIGNTTICIVAPKITKEENLSRIQSLEQVIESITGYQCTIKK